MKQKGYLVLSLDFELYWGMFDKVSLATYGANITGVHTVLPKLLRLFKERNIHATWATVGMLMHEDQQTLAKALPPQELRPQYEDMNMSSYTHLETENVSGLYYFGKNLVQQILETEGQELASHTFSHYYCIDGKQNSQAIFEADCNAMQEIADTYNTQLQSIVFPRNQTTQEALEVCEQFGITAYRGTEDHFLYTAKKESMQTNIVIRAFRLLDHYIHISGHHTYPLASVMESSLANVRASRFLRPYSNTLRFFEKLRIHRIKRSMEHAAQKGEIFHLWWHPHNFGIHQEKNLQTLTELLDHYAYLQATYGMESKTMHEIAKLASHT